VITGFFLVNKIAMIKNVQGVVRFTRNRLRRQIPLIWIALSVKVLLSIIGTATSLARCTPDECSPLNIVSAFLLLQIFVTGAISVFPPLWSISAGFFALLLFSSLFRLSINVRVFTGIVLGVVAILLSIWPETSPSTIEWANSAFPRALLGITLGAMVSNLKVRAQISRILFPIGILLFALMTTVDSSQIKYILVPTSFALMVSGMANLKNQANKAFNWIAFELGNLSFGIFVWNWVVIGPVRKIVGLIVENPNSDWASFITSMLTVILSIVLAKFTYELVERKMARRTSPV
jgi:peptidoglycan/LPS O-acetylase OafA/YrhL